MVSAKTKQVIDLPIGVFDAAGAFLSTPPYIGDGSLARVLAEFRPIKTTAGRMAGVRLEFSAVKVLQLAVPKSPFSEAPRAPR